MCVCVLLSWAKFTGPVSPQTDRQTLTSFRSFFPILCRCIPRCGCLTRKPKLRTRTPSQPPPPRPMPHPKHSPKAVGDCAPSVVTTPASSAPTTMCGVLPPSCAAGATPSSTAETPPTSSTARVPDCQTKETTEQTIYRRENQHEKRNYASHTGTNCRQTDSDQVTGMG